MKDSCLESQLTAREGMKIVPFLMFQDYTVSRNLRMCCKESFRILNVKHITDKKDLCLFGIKKVSTFVSEPSFVRLNAEYVSISG